MISYAEQTYTIGPEDRTGQLLPQQTGTAVFAD